MKNIVDNAHVKLEAKFKAFPYQAEAFNAVKDMTYSAIFHEQGLGKTKIAIDLSLYWLKNKEIDTVMIVTKKQLVNNWENEIKAHTYIRPKIINTNKGDNFGVFNSTAKIVLANFEAVVSEQERIKLFLKTRSVAIIIDESTKLKNPEANITKVFWKISNYFKIRVIMTGTPVANRPYDIWSQIYFLDFGESLGKDFKSFKNKTDLNNKLEGDEIAQKDLADNIEQIFNKISKFSVRETKKTCGIKLPNKNYIRIDAEFEKDQSIMYKKVINEFKLEISKHGKTVIDDEQESLKRLLRLNQVVSNPAIIDEKYNKKSGKEEALEKLIDTILGRDEKCIVWSSYIYNIDYYAKKYSKYGSRKIHGKMSLIDRNKSVDLFKNDKTCRILFATPQAAKEGLTLTTANNAIFYDRTFNLDDYLQAQDRIHRISQTKDCNIYTMVIENTIDDWIDALLNAKQNAAYLAQGDITKQDYQSIADYSYGEIINSILKGE